MFPTSSELDATLGEKTFPVSAGLPRLQVFTYPSNWARDSAAYTYAEAWQESHSTADGLHQVQLTGLVFQHPNEQPPAGFSCDRSAPLVSAALPRIYKSQLPSGLTRFCVEKVAEQVRIKVELTAPTAGDHTTEVRRIRQLSRQLKLARELPPEGEYDLAQFDSTRNDLRKTWMVGLLILCLTAVLPSVLFDRAFWQRLRAGPWSRKPKASQIYVETQVQLLAARCRAVSVLKFLVLVWAMRLAQQGGFSFLPISQASSLIALRTLATLGIAYVLINVVDRSFWAARRLGKSPGPRYRGMAQLWILYGVGGSFLIMVLAFFVLMIGVTMPTRAMHGVPSWRVDRSAIQIEILAGLLFLAAFAPLTWARRFAGLHKNTQPQFDPFLDQAPPVLMLRSFTDQNVRMRSRRLDRGRFFDLLTMRRWERFEEVIAAALSRFGVVMTAATPGQVLPPSLGAARLQFTHQEWQERVEELCSKAAFIVVVVGRSASLAWEIQRLNQLGHLGKTLFVVPPIRGGERTRRWHLLADVLGIDRAKILDPGDVRGARRPPPVVAVSFANGNPHEPQVVVADGLDDLSYDVALAELTSRIRELPRRLEDARYIHQPDFDKLDTFARGEAEPPKTWKNTGWLMVPALLAMVVSYGSEPYRAGDSFGDINARHHVVLPAGGQFDAVASDGHRHLAITNLTTLVELDFDQEQAAFRTRLPFVSHQLLIDGNLAFLANPGKGTVAAISVGKSSDRSQLAWRTQTSPNPRLALVGDELWVAEPTRRRITVLDANTGDELDRFQVGASLWDLAYDGQDAVYAVAPASSELITITAGEHQVVKREPSLASAVEVSVWRDGPVVLSNLVHLARAEPTGSAPVDIALTRTDAVCAATSEQLAVLDVEQISTRSATGTGKYNIFGDRNRGLVVVDAPTGETFLIVANHRQISRIRIKS